MKQIESQRTGQVTILALILGVLGLTVGLSVASRSLSDLRQASFTDFGTKALGAAEAGAEYGLNQVSQPGFSLAACQNTVLYDVNAGSNTFDFSAIGMSKVEIDICPDTSGYYLETGVPKDGVSQVDFSGAGALPSKVDVVWGGAPSIEVTALHSDYTVKRYAYNANGAGSTNNFTQAQNAGPGCGNNLVGGNCPNPGGLPYCVGPSNLTAIVGNNILLLRVKPIGGSADVQVCGIGANVPSQFYTVSATATTTNQTVRKVQVRRGGAVLPAEFDNVLYSGGSIVK